MEILIVSKEDLINTFRSADMLYAQSCMQHDLAVIERAHALRNEIGSFITQQFKLTADEFNHFIYALN